tara:strand:+ start:8931 stop:9455 length:525 start_codon:yes stop_codon:yes gene_type:complete
MTKNVNNKNDYINFNKHKKQLSRRNIRCGGILFTSCGKFIVIVQNRYVLDEQNKILWGLPKGHITQKETYAECASREILEETGINISISENHPKLKINNTFYFPIHLNYNFNQLTNIMHINDTIEINNIKLLEIDKIQQTAILNYELRKFIETYILRAKRIATENDISYVTRSI